jgi:molybdate transport system ATP-binding protein
MSISVQFQVRRDDFSLEVDLKLPSDGVTAVFGPSGCGKTTLLRTIAGLERHNGAVISLGDREWQSGSTFIPSHERSLGFVFQEASLFSHLTVKSNIEYGWKRVAKDQRTVSLQQVIELLGLGPFLHRSPQTLSGGERRRVAIARALAVSPSLLLMDEPLVGLDQERKREVLPYIEAMQNELRIPMIYVSHSADEVARLADHLVLMGGDGVIASGDVHDLFTRLDLPLAQQPDASAIIEATVADHDEEFHLTQLKFAGGSISIPREMRQPGERVRLRLAARDVSLTLEHQSDTSILNIFPAKVDQITAHGNAQFNVRLVADNVPLLARVTRKSASALALKPGRMVYAQAKSVALLN